MTANTTSQTRAGRASSHPIVVEIDLATPYAAVAPFWYYFAPGTHAALLSLTRKTDYALVAMASLARASSPRRRGTAAEPARASAHELADELHLPLPVLRNILKTLAHHGLLNSTQGSSGGYGLARPANDITLADVIQAMEGPVRLAVCCPIPEDETEQRCFREDSCRIKATVRRVHDRLREFLDTVSLADIASDRVPQYNSRGKRVRIARNSQQLVTLRS